MLSKTLERKVKKQLFAQPQTALIRYAPGFAAECEAEILSVTQSFIQPLEFVPKITQEVHWLRVENIDFRQLLELTGRMQTASDVWLIMAEKTIRAKEKLTSFLTDLDWELFLPTGSAVSLRVDSKQSHLYHEGMVEELAIEALKQPRLTVQKDAPWTIWLQLFQDRATISINLNGEPLYKRGVKTVLNQTATLQEHVASSLLWQHAVWLKSKGRNLSSAPTIYIPCCGSGTFGMETLLQRLNIPPALLGRAWAMQNLVCFPANTWGFLQQKWQSQLNERMSAATLPQMHLSDVDEKSVAAAKENMQALAQQLSCPALMETLQVTKADITKAALPAGGNRLILIHPPYGKRLPLAGRRQFFSDIGKRLQSDMQSGDSGFCLMPDAEVWHDFLSQIKGFQHHTTHFMQGGLDIRCVHFIRE